MEKREKERAVKGRVSFDVATGVSPTRSHFVDSLGIDRGNRVNSEQEQAVADLPPAPDEPARIRNVELEDMDPSPSSSGSLGDEPGSSLESESGYVLVGKHIRKMSNAMQALDLDLQPKRRPSFGQIRKGSSGVVASPYSTYLGHSPMSSETGAASAAGTSEGSDAFWRMTNTEQLLTKHSFKAQMAQCIQRMDRAFPFLHVSSISSRWRDSLVHGLDQLNSAIEEVWKKPKLDSDLASGMADHLRSTATLDALCRFFIEDKLGVREEAGKTIENYFSDRNRDYVVQQPWFSEFLSILLLDSDRSTESPIERERLRLSASLLDSLIRHGAETCRKIVSAGGLEFLLHTCRGEWENGTGEEDWETLRDAASALCNLAVLGGRDIRKAMVEKDIPAWMFVLLSHKDLRIRYHACLIVSVIASERELESAVEQSQTLPLVMTFMQSHQPSDMAPLDIKYRHERTKPWLAAVAPMLRSSRTEVQALACFQFAKEAHVRRCKEDETQVFEEVGAMSALKEIAASPMNPVAASFAEQVLRIAGEVLPRRLSQSVPLWSVADVEFWVCQIGFGDYAGQFARYRVDGELLLQTVDRHLINEIGMTSEYERMRFMRELNSLKISADYSCVDPTRLDMWLMCLDKAMSVYTYDMLRNGIDRRTLINIDENVLKNEAGISNTVHRTKILHAVKEVKHVDELDVALLRKHVDIFICYRRSTGSQLASLLKVHLQLRGYKVFIDVDRLYAGQFDASLLKNIRAAKHFLLVLTPHALDRCVGDRSCKDWVHLEIRTALEFGRNIIPVQDKGFVWPQLSSLPEDVRPIAFFNAVQWVHEYQEACVEKLDKFLKGEHRNAQEGAGGQLSSLVHPSQRATAMLETPPTITKQMSECATSRPEMKRSSTLGRLDSI